METVKLRAGQTRAAAGRVALLLVLLVAAGVALRGRMPTPQQTPRSTASADGSLTGVVALLSVSMLVMAFAMLHRRSGPPRPPAREFPVDPRGARGGWNLRLGLIALGLLIAWLLAVVVLNRLGVGPDSQQIASPDAVSDPAGMTPSEPSPAAPSSPHKDTSRLLIATTAALLMMMVVATVLSAIRRPRRQALPVSSGADAESAAGSEPLAIAAERGLAEVANPNLPPREAIIACYAAMEQALAGAPNTAPQASDTPSEVLARAVATRALSPANATPLVEVFAEARYSTHEMTEQHRQTAERALRSVLGELRSPV
jgi:hypothetical protein